RLVQLWTAAGRPAGGPLAHQAPVGGAAFSPDGRVLAVLCPEGVGRLWEVATGRPLGLPLACRRFPSTPAFTPDRQTLLVTTPPPLPPVDPGRRPAAAPALSWNGRELTAWDVRTGQRKGEPVPVPHPLANILAFSADRKTIITAHHNALLDEPRQGAKQEVRF